MTSGASMQDPSVNRASYDSVNMKLGRPQDPSDWESWSVKSYEISILTGMLQRGAQENLMVLSDEMFRQCAEASPGGPSSLCLVTCAPENYSRIDQALLPLRTPMPMMNRWTWISGFITERISWSTTSFPSVIPKLRCTDLYS